MSAFGLTPLPPLVWTSFMYGPLLLSIAQDCWGWRDFKERFLEDQEWNCWKGKEYGWYQEEDIGCRALYCSNKQEYCYPKLQSGGKSRKYHHNPTFTQPWIICNSPIGIHPRTDWHESDKNLNFLDIRQLPVLNKLLWNTICRKNHCQSQGGLDDFQRWIKWFVYSTFHLFNLASTQLFLHRCNHLFTQHSKSRRCTCIDARSHRCVSSKIAQDIPLTIWKSEFRMMDMTAIRGCDSSYFT